MICFLVDDLEELSLLWGVPLDVLAPQRGGVALDETERSPQLVRHGGEQLSAQHFHSSCGLEPRPILRQACLLESHADLLRDALQQGQCVLVETLAAVAHQHEYTERFVVHADGGAPAGAASRWLPAACGERAMIADLTSHIG